MNFNQKTLKNKVKALGIGLHSGKPVRIELIPSYSDSGIIFYRRDIGQYIKLDINNIVSTKLATTIGCKDFTISTIEHLLSAIYAYSIDNIIIELDGPEIPIMDGSSIPFCMMLDEASIEYLDKPKYVMVITDSVEVKDGEKWVKIEPDSDPIFDYTINFDNSVIGKSRHIFHFSREKYIKDIARARTFGLLKEIQMLRKNGLALGGSLDNAIVVDDYKIINPDGIRCEKEFVKHKILDAIGDLRILQYPILGKYSAYMGSHKLNFELSKSILKNSNYEIVKIEEIYHNPQYSLNRYHIFA